MDVSRQFLALLKDAAEHPLHEHSCATATSELSCFCRPCSASVGSCMPVLRPAAVASQATVVCCSPLQAQESKAVIRLEFVSKA